VVVRFLIFHLYFHFYLADRKKVLKHHPDKKASSTSSEFSNSLYLAGVNQNTNDDAFFKCIQKAHEVLTNSEKRRQFDSVDPVFMELEEDMPTASEIKVSPNLFSFFLYILRGLMFFGCC
jgi:DnaJ family protein C protein 2